MQIAELMAQEFAAETALTRRLIARIPDDKLAWKPSETLNTIGWNAAHLVNIAGWVPGIIAQSELDISSVDTAIKPSTVAELLTILDENVSMSLAAFQGAPDEVMAEPWSLKAGGHTLFTMNKGDCLRKWVFGHIAHHRGILSVYLRMAGVVFPSLYEE